MNQETTPAVACPVDRKVMHHTPGPWFVRHEVWSGGPMLREGGCFSIEDSEDAFESNVICSRFPWPEKAAELEANARLIAAAPDLLDALQDLADDIADRFDMDSDSTNPGMKYAVRQARAAIAKALGRDA